MARAEQITETQLEELIDRTSLAIILEVIAEICHGKAEHLQVNWQDSTSARQWAEMGGVLSTAARRSRNKFGR